MKDGTKLNEDEDEQREQKTIELQVTIGRMKKERMKHAKIPGVSLGQQVDEGVSLGVGENVDDSALAWVNKSRAAEQGNLLRSHHSAGRVLFCLSSSSLTDIVFICICCCCCYCCCCFMTQQIS